MQNLEGNNITLYWEFNNVTDDGNSTIDFLITYNMITWFGLGFGSSMTNTDMAII